ncbi:MAG TPA: helix-turn-helix domain-containing protein [Candidatus Limnocylindrales bacterium]
MSTLTTTDLAVRWHLHRQTAWRLAKSIPGAMFIGRRWTVPIEAVEAFERRHSTQDPMSMTPLSAARSR